MDVRHYFNPVNFSAFSEIIAENWKYSFGQAIDKSTKKLTETNLKKVDAVIFGVPCFEGVWEESKKKPTNKIREELYKLAHLPGKLNIVDLGDLKPSASIKGTYLALRDLIEIFSELNIVSIVIGGSSDLSTGICEAFLNEKIFTITSIDAQLDVKKGQENLNSTNYLSRILQKMPNLFQFNLLGYQRHLVAPELFSKTNGFGEHLSLGELHDNIKKAEPVLRNTNVLTFDIKSVKHAEIAGSSYFNPNGLLSNEICQLAKYAGMSTKLKVFGLFEAEIKKDNFDITFKLVSQIIWYFFEGLTIRKDDLGPMNENVLTYKVEIDGMEKPLKFFFCGESRRWWYEIQSLNNEKFIVACSESEYQNALNNEIPELWLNYVQKIDNLSK